MAPVSLHTATECLQDAFSGALASRSKSFSDLTAIDFADSRMSFADSQTSSADLRTPSATTPLMTPRHARCRKTGAVVMGFDTPPNTKVTVVVCPGAPVKSKGTFKLHGAARRPSRFMRRLSFDIEDLTASSPPSTTTNVSASSASNAHGCV